MKTITLMGRSLTVAALLFTAAATSRAQGMVGETVPQSQAVLRSYFQTNAVPTQLDYWEWIDTMFWYVMSTYTNSQAAAQSAAAAQGASQNAFALLEISTYYVQGPDSQVAFYYVATNGFSSNSFLSGIDSGGEAAYLYATDYFATPITDMRSVYYVPRTSLGNGTVGNNGLEPSSFSILQVTNTYIAFYYSAVATEAPTNYLTLQFFH